MSDCGQPGRSQFEPHSHHQPGRGSNRDRSMPSVTMTYAELAARLGRTESATKSLAKRKRWRRSVGNDGLARITVDEDELAGMADPDRRGIGRPPANSVRSSVTEPGSNP